MQRNLLVALGVPALVILPLFVSADSPQKGSEQNDFRIPRELLEQRLTAARQVFEQDLKRRQAGESESDERLMRWSEHWLDAQLALAHNARERKSAFEDHVKRLKDLEKMYLAYVRTGQARESDGHAATYYRAQAEIRMLEAAATTKSD